MMRLRYGVRDKASLSDLFGLHPAFLEDHPPFLHFLLQVSGRLVGRAGDDFHAALAPPGDRFRGTEDAARLMSGIGRFVI